MSYKRERMRRAYEDPSRDLKRDQRQAPKRDRGMKFTFLSFAVVAGTMAVMKAINPDIPMRSPIMMFASVFLGCMFMILIARRMK
ncbi:hypothetical protein LJC31_05530 [Synergistaceae bacterium OttesenSCG-928-I11]|nr:hypothetical protein [Synergistaceae bacterium OttesenSCG-928-I11]